MDKSERRRLKKLGKEVIEQRSADLQQALKDANPVPIESEQWAKNYRTGTLNEKWLRKKLPLMHKSEWQTKFVLRVDDSPGSTIKQGYKPRLAEDGTLRGGIGSAYEFIGTEDTYIQCLSCESFSSVMPPLMWLYWKSCRCGNIRRARIFSWCSLRVVDTEQIRFVKLLGKGPHRAKD